MTPIAIHFDPEFDDYLHGMRLFDAKEIASPRSMIRLLVACVVLGVALFSLYRQWPYLLVGPAVFAMVRLAIFSVRKSQCRSIVTAKVAQGPFEVTFDENGMVSQARSGKTELQWHAFEKVIESDRVFLLVYSKYGYLTVPKRAFVSPAQTDEFRELATRKISQGASTSEGPA